MRCISILYSVPRKSKGLESALQARTTIFFFYGNVSPRESFFVFLPG